MTESAAHRRDIQETLGQFVQRTQRNRTGAVLSGNARLAAWVTLGTLSVPYLLWAIAWILRKEGMWFGNNVAVAGVNIATHPVVLVASAVFAAVVAVALIGTHENPPHSYTWTAMAGAVVVAGIVAIPATVVLLVIAVNIAAVVAAMIAVAAGIVFVLWALAMALSD